MSGLGLLLILALLVAVAGGVLLALRMRQDRPPQLIDPADEAELDAIFAQVAHDAALPGLARLAEQLKRMAARSVPLRWVRPSAVASRARLGFADGTVVVARSHGSGLFVVLARHAANGQVRPTQVVLRDEWIELDLRWPGGHMMVDVLGTDQAD